MLVKGAQGWLQNKPSFLSSFCAVSDFLATFTVQIKSFKWQIGLHDIAMAWLMIYGIIQIAS